MNEELSKHWKSLDRGNVIIFLLKNTVEGKLDYIDKEMPEGLLAVKRALGKQSRTKRMFSFKHLNLYQNSDTIFAHNLLHIRDGLHGGKKL